MTQRPHAGDTSGERARQERTIDKMVEDTLPASDATQLPGRAAGTPGPGAARDDAKGEAPSPKPSTIGNQGVAPSTRMREESVALAADAVATFRFDTQARRLSLRFSDEEAMLDADALDRLIEALSRKRAQMGD